jgi:hypothetical protein
MKHYAASIGIVTWRSIHSHALRSVGSDKNFPYFRHLKSCLRHWLLSLNVSLKYKLLQLGHANVHIYTRELLIYSTELHSMLYPRKIKSLYRKLHNPRVSNGDDKTKWRIFVHTTGILQIKRSLWTERVWKMEKKCQERWKDRSINLIQFFKVHFRNQNSLT